MNRMFNFDILYYFYRTRCIGQPLIPASKEKHRPTKIITVQELKREEHSLGGVENSWLRLIEQPRPTGDWTIHMSICFVETVQGCAAPFPVFMLFLCVLKVPIQYINVKIRVEARVQQAALRSNEDNKLPAHHFGCAYRIQVYRF